MHKRLPDDHPIYKEGVSYVFVNMRPPRTTAPSQPPPSDPEAEPQPPPPSIKPPLK